MCLLPVSRVLNLSKIAMFRVIFSTNFQKLDQNTSLCIIDDSFIIFLSFKTSISLYLMKNHAEQWAYIQWAV